MNPADPFRIDSDFISNLPKYDSALTSIIDNKRETKKFNNPATNEENSLVRYRYRDVADHKENKVRLEFSDSYFDKIKFSDITIKEVHINNDNQIAFFGKTNRTDPLSKEPEQPIILLKNIEGDLLKRFKMNVHQMREGLHEYDDRIMNLRKY